MLLPGKQFRPRATHGTVYQLSFTYRVAERVKRRSVLASESTARELGGVCTFIAVMMKKVALLTLSVGILWDILQGDNLRRRGSTSL